MIKSTITVFNVLPPAFITLNSLLTGLLFLFRSSTGTELSKLLGKFKMLNYAFLSDGNNFAFVIS